MSIETLRQLHTIIGNSLSTLESTFSAERLRYPSLDVPYAPDSPAELLTTSPDVVEATNLLVSAAEQLVATIKLPYLSLCDAAMAYHVPACLAFVERVNVVEILASAGRLGMHAKDVAVKASVNPTRLEHVLRLLATHHFFREVTPGVFANNRLSSLLDSKKPHTALVENPRSKYPGSSGAAALVGVFGDEMFKAAALFTDTYVDPRTSHSLLPEDSAFSKAFGTNKGYFDWLEDSDNQDRLSRFGHAIMGISLYEHPEAIQSAYNWTKLPTDGLVVDVGGGLGFASLRLSREFPLLRFIIQDRPKVVAVAQTVWQAENPKDLDSGRVEICAHDFFEPQPIQDASVFLLRAVCHDWSDQDASRILVHLRRAARPDTVLVLGDNIMPYACSDDSPASDLPGAQKRLAPPPLLANLGKASVTASYMDMTMQTMCNSHERSLQGLVDLTHDAGWEVVEVKLIGVSRFGYVIARPF